MEPGTTWDSRASLDGDDLLESTNAPWSSWPPDDGDMSQGGADGVCQVRQAILRRLVELFVCGSLKSAMAALSALERHVLYFRYWEDLTREHMATRLGISQMQVSRLIRRSLEMLRSALEEPEYGEMASRDSQN